MTKPRLFISSTKADLEAYRKVASDAAYRLGFDVDMMEDFGPDGSAPVELCREKAESADLLLGLYAHRHGFQHKDFGGRSLTQMEYEWAHDAGATVLAFIVDDDQPWSPKFIDKGDSAAALEAFKAKLLDTHVAVRFTSPDDLRAKLFQHLPKFNERTKIAPTDAKPTRAFPTPAPPEPYVVHRYTLLQTNQLIGRREELALLNSWVSGTGGPLTQARILCLVAIGGMGKSALTWKWFNESAEAAMHSLAGRMWWSFYEADAGFDRFIMAALAYCGRRDPETVAALSPARREEELLAILDHEPHLIAMDGAERLLIAYSGMDFAHLADDELDRRTANRVAGHMGLKPEEAASLTAQQRLRKAIDPHVDNFLRKLAGARAARILMTTRLYPFGLQTVTGHEIPGAAAVFLKGLKTADALALWRAMNVSGSDTELSRMFAIFDNYPLLIRALAGEVARFRGAPGNFDLWRKYNPNFEPFKLPLDQVKTHVLEHALTNLEPAARRLLTTIAAFRAPARYETLLRLHQTPEHGGAAGLDGLLQEIEDRGLVGWDRRTNTYDLHPIVRGVVWSGLGDGARRGILKDLHDHFSAAPKLDIGSEREMTFEEVSPGIELFNALVGLGRFDDASEVFFDRIENGFSFEDTGYVTIKRAMLESLFPNGLEHCARGIKDAAIAQLGHTYVHLGMLRDAAECYTFLLGNVVHGFLTEKHLSPNAYLRWLGSVFLAVGRISAAAEMLRVSLRLEENDMFSPYVEAEIRFVCGDAEGALGIFDRLASEVAPGYARSMGNKCCFMQRIPLRYPLRGDDYCELGKNHLLAGRCEQALEVFRSALLVARRNSRMEAEIDALLGTAEGLFGLGRNGPAREMLRDCFQLAQGKQYPVQLSDAHWILAGIELSDGHKAAAVEAAEEAYRQAWCQGPPFAYHWGLERAKALLDRLGATYPDTPRDDNFDDVVVRVAELIPQLPPPKRR
jgi:tetratricopeptide (TPR) repeat protein